MTDRFSWIPLYEKLANSLAGWEERQHELIEFVDDLRQRGFKVTQMHDVDKTEARIKLQEIDPFTFFGIFNRGIKNEERSRILQEIKTSFGLKSPLPDDFDGIPVLNNQSSRFFGYQYERGKEDIPKLWRVFKLALGDNAEQNKDFQQAFNEALKIQMVSVNLTMGLFWIRPHRFINLDKVNRDYLGIKIPYKGLSWNFYSNILRETRKRNKPFPQLSYDAWQAVTKSAPTENCDYWLVSAYWDGEEDKSKHFLKDGIWENNWDDKYLEQVKSMKPDDRIAIKAAVTQKSNLPFDAKGNTVSKIIIKARGRIVKNRGDGKTVEVEWDRDFEPKEWFFFTYRGTVWHLRTDEGYQFLHYSKRLIDFIWNDKSQDYDWFLNNWYEMEDGNNIPYSVKDIVDSGVFLEENEIERTLDRLRTKKNLILQGSPGVGKTFIARKLAYALMAEMSDDRIEMIQFHQSYCYEDFVRGYRPLPGEGGKFGLKNAVFYNFCKKAEKDPDNPYVFIIDEINRGNLSRIFGELLMLIEGDKRGKEHALPLMYSQDEEERFHVPANLYIIGMMNLADRSLAIVDYALRRRFAFMTLTPKFDSRAFRDWLEENNMATELIDLVVTRMSELNSNIADDPLLGSNYEVGHSYFCPRGEDFSELDREWYEDVVRTEIVPLLKEYWFDNEEKLEDARQKLLAP